MDSPDAVQICPEVQGMVVSRYSYVDGRTYVIGMTVDGKTNPSGIDVFDFGKENDEVGACELREAILRITGSRGRSFPVTCDNCSFNGDIFEIDRGDLYPSEARVLEQIAVESDQVGKPYPSKKKILHGGYGRKGTRYIPGPDLTFPVPGVDPNLGEQLSIPSDPGTVIFRPGEIMERGVNERHLIPVKGENALAVNPKVKMFRGISFPEAEIPVPEGCDILGYVTQMLTLQSGEAKVVLGRRVEQIPVPNGGEVYEVGPYFIGFAGAICNDQCQVVSCGLRDAATEALKARASKQLFEAEIE